MNVQQLLRYAAGIAIALVLLVLLLVIGISVYRGVGEQQIVGLASVVATLVALLVALLGGGAALVSITGVERQVGVVQGQVSDVQEKMNGHLDAHQVQVQQLQGLVDQHFQQVNDIIDQRLRELGLAPPTPPAPPASPPPAPGAGD